MKLFFKDLWNYKGRILILIIIFLILGITGDLPPNFLQLFFQSFLLAIIIVACFRFFKRKGIL